MGTISNFNVQAMVVYAIVMVITIFSVAVDPEEFRHTRAIRYAVYGSRFLFAAMIIFAFINMFQEGANY